MSAVLITVGLLCVWPLIVGSIMVFIAKRGIHINLGGGSSSQFDDVESESPKLSQRLK